MTEQVPGEAHKLLSDEDKAFADILTTRGYVDVQSAGVHYLVPTGDALRALATPGLDPKFRKALLDQLDAWLTLAKFAKWLSVGLAVGSLALLVFLLSAMTWDDLFAGSGLWELGVVLFALTVLTASPLAIFVIGRPLKGVDEWSPTLSAGPPDAGEQGA